MPFADLKRCPAVSDQLFKFPSTHRSYVFHENDCSKRYLAALLCLLLKLFNFIYVHVFQNFASSCFQQEKKFPHMSHSHLQLSESEPTLKQLRYNIHLFWDPFSNWGNFVSFSEYSKSMKLNLSFLWRDFGFYEILRHIYFTDVSSQQRIMTEILALHTQKCEIKETRDFFFKTGRPKWRHFERGDVVIP